MAKAILLSGGIDSACIAFWKKPELAININYGQKSSTAERNASKSIAKALNIKFETIDIDCSTIGSGDLVTQKPSILAPVTEWWPYRNQLLITLASTLAINFDVNELMIGAVSSDKTHRDGTIKFFELINSLMEYQEGRIRISAPGIEMSSIELIKRTQIPTSILGWTHSCHVGNYPCGICNGCKKHFSIKEQLNLI